MKSVGVGNRAKRFNNLKGGGKVGKNVGKRNKRKTQKHKTLPRKLRNRRTKKRRN